MTRDDNEDREISKVEQRILDGAREAGRLSKQAENQAKDAGDYIASKTFDPVAQAIVGVGKDPQRAVSEIKSRSGRIAKRAYDRGRGNVRDEDIQDEVEREI